MRFNTVIIGGGLSGLVCGIELARKGNKVAIVAAGQSALHFSSGTIGLLGADGNPFDAMASLGESHPYSKVGIDRVKALAAEVHSLFAEAGINLVGNANSNCYRITTFGQLRPTWLALEGIATVPAADKLPWKKVNIVTIDGFLDFPNKFLAAGLEKNGAECNMRSITIPELTELRKSPTEMRAVNVARVLDKKDSRTKLAAAINDAIGDGEATLIPAVAGLASSEAAKALLDEIDGEAYFVPTLPPSVAGIRIQTLLRQYFQRLGGTYLLGDTVNGGNFAADGSLQSVTTVNLEGDVLAADNFVLASGSFMSHGIAATNNGVVETAFGLDVDATADREQWSTANIFEAQPFMEMGVHTDANLHPSKGGKTVNNLFAIGSVLSGHNSLKQFDGEGVSVITALHAAKSIINK